MGARSMKMYDVVTAGMDEAAQAQSGGGVYRIADRQGMAGDTGLSRAAP